jgi:hypothetical protein
MSGMGFEPTISVFENEMAFHGLDYAATITGWISFIKKMFTIETYFDSTCHYEILNYIRTDGMLSQYIISVIYEPDQYLKPHHIPMTLSVPLSYVFLYSHIRHCESKQQLFCYICLN